ncbi:hypothetical protein, partial [Streptomyces minutiscleroticus]|uniref:hypothetical protein n=1 Tax=Streptomyces minutiscleroticus TaxID=68238 RepID=UPI00332BA693
MIGEQSTSMSARPYPAFHRPAVPSDLLLLFAAGRGLVGVGVGVGEVCRSAVDTYRPTALAARATAGHRGPGRAHRSADCGRNEQDG